MRTSAEVYAEQKRLSDELLKLADKHEKALGEQFRKAALQVISKSGVMVFTK